MGIQGLTGDSWWARCMLVAGDDRNACRHRVHRALLPTLSSQALTLSSQALTLSTLSTPRQLSALPTPSTPSTSKQLPALPAHSQASRTPSHSPSFLATQFIHSAATCVPTVSDNRLAKMWGLRHESRATSVYGKSIERALSQAAPPRSPQHMRYTRSTRGIDCFLCRWPSSARLAAGFLLQDIES